MNKRMLVPMTEVIDSISMGPFGSDLKVEFFVEKGIPVLNGSNLTSIRMNDDSFNFVTEEKANSLPKSIARRGDIVVTHRGTLGQLSYIPENSKYEKYLISQSQFRVTLNTDKVDPVYFAYYFHTNEGQKRLLSFANYVGVPALASATTNFKELQFPLIDIEVQRKISRVLVDIEDKIKNNNAIIVELESMAKTLYDYWFLQFEFPNEEGKPYKSSGGAMVWNDELKREIPEGWKVGYLSDIADITMGSSPTGDSLNDNNDGVIFYQGKTDFGYRFPSVRVYTTKPVRYAEENSILLSVRAPVGDINIADEKCCIGRGLASLLSEHQSYLYYLMLANQAQFNKYNQSGTTFGAITKDELYKMKIIVPKDNVIERFDNQVKNLDNKIKNNEKQNKELTSLRDFLLPMLMNGQVTFK